MEVQFSTALALFKKIHVTPSEFINWAKLDAATNLPATIIQAINNEDIATLRRFTLAQLKHYQKDKNIFILADAIIVFNQLLLLTSKDYLSAADKHRLVFYLTHNSVWSEYNITLFVNSSFLLDSKTIYHIALKLIHNFS